MSVAQTRSARESELYILSLTVTNKYSRFHLRVDSWGLHILDEAHVPNICTVCGALETRKGSASTEKIKASQAGGIRHDSVALAET